MCACNKSSEAEEILGNNNVKAALVGLWKLTEVSEYDKEYDNRCTSNFNTTARFSSDGAMSINSKGASCSRLLPTPTSFNNSTNIESWKIQADGKELLIDDRKRFTISRLTQTSLTLTTTVGGTIQRESWERVN